jgi:hypothetical protein
MKTAVFVSLIAGASALEIQEILHLLKKPNFRIIWIKFANYFSQ